MRTVGRIVLAVLACCLAASEPSASAEPARRGIFVSVIQDPPVLSSRRLIEDLVAHCRASGTGAIFVQVHRANLSWFESAVADDRPYRECRQLVGEDPLALLIRRAHEEGIEVHGWLNLLSLGANDEAPLLARYGPSILARGPVPPGTLEGYRVDGQYFLEPGDPRVRAAMVELVTELVSAYPGLDGVQFDYIRYPDWRPDYGYAEANVARYRSETGEGSPERGRESWTRWKEAQVTSLVEELARAARSIRPGLQVSTTGLAPYARAKHEAHQDWKDWIDRGLVDFVTLMCYVRDGAAFDRYLRDAGRRLGSLEKLNVAVGAYALTDDPDTYHRQMLSCEESDSRACLVLHYGNLIEHPELARTRRGPPS